MTKYGYTLHLNIPELGMSETIYKTAEACDKAAQHAISKGYTGYAANCEYKPNPDKPSGFEVIEEWNRVSF